MALLAEAAADASFDAVRAFLLAQFDPLTGCIPPDDALQRAVEAGEMLCLTDEAGITGLLHYAPGRAACEIRHLAVRADCRGQGLAQRLLGMLRARTGGRFYEKNDFRPDGWTSVVLRLD